MHMAQEQAEVFGPIAVWHNNAHAVTWDACVGTPDWMPSGLSWAARSSSLIGSKLREMRVPRPGGMSGQRVRFCFDFGFCDDTICLLVLTVDPSVDTLRLELWCLYQAVGSANKMSLWACCLTRVWYVSDTKAKLVNKMNNVNVPSARSISLTLLVL